MMLILRLFKQYILGWILLVLYSIVAMVGTILTLGRLNDTFGRQMIRSWGRTMLWCCGIKLKVEGLEHVEERTSRVILYNHESTLDIFIIAALLSPGGVLVVKRELRFVPFLGWAISLMDFIFLDRKNPERAKKSMLKAGARVNKDKLSPVVAPEGTRSYPDKLRPFKKGPFHLAFDSQAPLYPMTIHRAGAHWPRTIPYCRTPGTILVRFLAPHTLKAKDRSALQADIDEVRGRFLRELGQEDSFSG